MRFGFLCVLMLYLGLPCLADQPSADQPSADQPSTDQPSAEQPSAIPENDSRFRVIRPAENDFKPKDLPAGLNKQELTFWVHSIGTDDTPALTVATDQAGSRVWVDAARNLTWTELTKVNVLPAQAEGVAPVADQWAGTIKTQSSSSRVPSYGRCLIDDGQECPGYGRHMMTVLPKTSGKSATTVLVERCWGRLSGTDD